MKSKRNKEKALNDAERLNYAINILHLNIRNDVERMWQLFEEDEFGDFEAIGGGMMENLHEFLKNCTDPDGRHHSLLQRLTELFPYEEVADEY